MRIWFTLAAAALLAGPAFAGGDALAGRWKVTIFEDGQYLNFWLVSLETKDGKLTGNVQTLAKIPETSLTNARVDGDLVQMSFRLANGILFNFEGKLPRAGGKKFYGSITRAGNSTPAFFEATQAKNAFDVNLDSLTRTPNDPRVFSALLGLIPQAKKNQAAPRDVQEWVDGVLKTAESYGSVWQTEFGIKLVAALQPEYPALAAEAGAKIEKSFDAKTPLDAQFRLLTALTSAYEAAGQPAEAAKLSARLAKLESEAHAQNEKEILDFKIEPYKGKVGQPVLVELFTGAQCPPCVGADIGFDALGKAFKETDIALLQYHLHIPDADALCNAAAEARADFYARSLRGTPAIYFNGKPLAPGGGSREDGEEKYLEYRGVVEKLIGKEPGGKLALTADRKGDVITIVAEASVAADVKGKIKVRLVLVEDWARYKGRNGLTFHHRVVRAMPGGPDGFAVDGKWAQTVAVDVAATRATLNRYLDDFTKNEGPFPDAQRPMRLDRLHVVAFLQNDETNEVLQAISVPVKGE